LGEEKANQMKQLKWFRQQMVSVTFNGLAENIACFIWDALFHLPHPARRLNSHG
jgi:aryl carrier-like protein